MTDEDNAVISFNDESLLLDKIYINTEKSFVYTVQKVAEPVS